MLHEELPHKTLETRDGNGERRYLPDDKDTARNSINTFVLFKSKRTFVKFTQEVPISLNTLGLQTTLLTSIIPK